MDLQKTSIFISLILRHKPEAAGISLDEHGWADVEELIDGVNASGKYFLDRDILEEIVRTDEKTRYSFNEDHTLIRANQGHSVPVDVELEEQTPPAILYHGTGERSVPFIDEQGLLPKSRLYVHLSADPETAKKVGRRHGRPVIYMVDCKAMAADGYKFYLSVNKVWLTKEVPPKYLEKLTVRRFTDQDAEAVSELIRTTLKESNAKDYPEAVIAELLERHTPDYVKNRASQTHFYVAENKAGIIGCGAIGPYWGKEDESALFTIFILPAYQGKGIGKAIVETLEKDEYALRAKRIEVAASITALEFYRKMGYGFKDGHSEPDEELLYRLEKWTVAGGKEGF